MKQNLDKFAKQETDLGTWQKKINMNSRSLQMLKRIWRYLQKYKG